MKIPPLRDHKGRFASYADVYQDKQGHWRMPSGRFASSEVVANRHKWLRSQQRSKTTGRFVSKPFVEIIAKSRSKRGKPVAPIAKRPERIHVTLNYRLAAIESFWDFEGQLSVLKVRDRIMELIEKHATFHFMAYHWEKKPNEALGQQIDYTREIMEHSGWSVEQLNMDDIYEMKRRYLDGEEGGDVFYPKLNEDGVPTDHYRLRLDITPANLDDLYMIYKKAPLFIHEWITWLSADYQA